MTQFYTYLHCKPNGDPFYVGKGFGRRSHIFMHGRNQHHRNIVAKHGLENIEVLRFPRESEAQALTDEIQWIKLLREVGYVLCNQTDGGEGTSGHIKSAKVRAKISAASIGRKLPPLSCGAKEKISRANKGKIISLTTRKKISAANLGKVLSAETLVKMSMAKKGKHHSLEQLATRKCMLGKKHSVETRRKMSVSAKLARAKRKQIEAINQGENHE